MLTNLPRQQLQVNAVYSALASSLAFTAIIAAIFSFLRPYNQVVYAPRLKHADTKHAPPPVGPGYLSWVKPLWFTKEHDIVQRIGLDATLFLRFTRMCRNIFLVLSVLYCAVLIPVNSFNSVNSENDTWLDRITPLQAQTRNQWALVVISWAATFTICSFLVWNYHKVVGLRQQYFESKEYRQSLHARTLMITDVPKQYRNDEGLAMIIDKVAPDASFSRTTIARNVKHIPSLITEYEDAVRKLEAVLAKYLKDPENLPNARPLCLPNKGPNFDGKTKVDAIEYWNFRVSRLRTQIVEARKAIDKRNAYPYGFASFTETTEAHMVAYASRKQHPANVTIRLAPQPINLIWENLHLNPSARRIRRFMVNIWTAILTILWIGPNALLAVFLVNLGNLAKVWDSFATELNKNPKFWSIVQGVAAPAVTSGLYLVLPIIFRRLSTRAGDQTKTGRERHVMANLYSFFIFNNLIAFSLFSTIWAYVASIINDTSQGNDVWKSILTHELQEPMFISLCKISPFWVTWLLQRQLGAAVDLAQIWKLVYSTVVRRISHPTPREIIELTAPPTFDYAMYYNYFLFYSTVALCFAGLQPLVLPSAALYFALDVWLKKYLILYIFVTKTESGGLFWRPLFNRLLFATILSNFVAFLTAWVRGNGSHAEAYAIIPLPFIVIGFKIICRKMYDEKLYYYCTMSGHPKPQVNTSQNEKLSARFGHPVLYKQLFKPMIHKNAQYKLHEVLNLHLDDDHTGYMSCSDSVIKMDRISEVSEKPNKSYILRNFELVADTNLDFEHYKNRPEFTDEYYEDNSLACPMIFSNGHVINVGSHLGTPVKEESVLRSFSSAAASCTNSPVPSAGPSVAESYSTEDKSQSDLAMVLPSQRKSPFYKLQNETQISLVRPGTPAATLSSWNPSRVRAFCDPAGYGPIPQADEQPEGNSSTYDFRIYRS